MSMTLEIPLGATVRLLKGYSMWTKQRTNVDAYCGKTGTVLRRSGDDYLVEIGASEVWFHAGRCEVVKP